MKRIIFIMLLLVLALANSVAMTNKGMKALIMDFEGCRLTAYKCPASVWTIGYGSTRNVEPGMVITKQEAIERLKEDIERFEAYVEIKVPGATWNQKDCYISFTFNLGKVLKGELLDAIESGNMIRVRQLILNYCHARVDGEMITLRGLQRRRIAEANWHDKGTIEGKYTLKGKVVIILR